MYVHLYFHIKHWTDRLAMGFSFIPLMFACSLNVFVQGSIAWHHCPLEHLYLPIIGHLCHQSIYQPSCIHCHLLDSFCTVAKHMMTLSEGIHIRWDMVQTKLSSTIIWATLVMIKQVVSLMHTMHPTSLLK